ncbi:MAG: hypothetical protein GF330_14785, partial [Candidatus Eisenbacteria bacterium]|nr:hypothetical protein [Candidatus Eisenbacteria bacterium]
MGQSSRIPAIDEQFAALGPAIARERQRISEERMFARLWQRDHTLWKDDPRGIVDRLGWLDCPAAMPAALPELERFAQQVRDAGLTHALLLGMGGSSLAAEVMRRMLGVRAGFLDLAILDSTDPATIAQRAARSDPARTLFIVATKSGGTVETLSFLHYFYTRLRDGLGAEGAGQRFVAITDPDSRLDHLATELGFRRTFRNDPEIGGRFSALSYFGLVPAALIGADLSGLLQGGARMAEFCREADSDVREPHPVASLAAALAAGTRAGRDKLTLIGSPRLAP